VVFDRLMRTGVAADQVRGASTDTPSADTANSRVGQCWIASKAEVVIAAKAQQAPTVNRQVDAVHRLHDSTMPA